MVYPSISNSNVKNILCDFESHTLFHSCLVSFSKPDDPHDPVEAARLQQLQVAAAQWQHVQQQRAGLQYQALMQQHEKLQQILEKYQQLIQQPSDLQVDKCDSFLAGCFLWYGDDLYGKYKIKSQHSMSSKPKNKSI